MALFTIDCTTCKARLRVKNESAIGQILACPHCGSMVLVEPPDDRLEALRAPATAPAALGRAGVGDRDPSRPVIDGEIARADGQPAGSPRAGDGASSDSEARPQAEPGSSSGAAAAPLPTADWACPAAQQWRQVLMLGSAAVAGVVLAVAVYGLCASRSTSAPAQTRQALQSPATPSAAGGDRQAAAAPTRTETAAQAIASAAQREPVLEEAPPGRPGADSLRGRKSLPTPGPDPARSALGQSPPARPLDANPLDRSVGAPASAASSAVSKESAAMPADHVLKPPPRGELAAEVSAFGGLAAAPPERGPRTGDDAAEVSSSSVWPKPSGEVPRPRPTTPRVADVEAGLACELEEIEFPGTALADFLQVMSDLTAVPITLDADALALVNVSAETPVQMRQSNTRVGEVLSAALRPLGLSYLTAAGHLTVTSPEAISEDLEQVSYDVADLAPGDPARLASLEDLVRAMAAPDSWTTAGGRGVLESKQQSLSVRQTRAAQFRVLELLEKLRVARGLEPRSGLSPSLFRLEPRRSRARQGLSALVTLNYSQPTPLVRILDRLGEAASMRILVDWRAASEAGWSPDAEAALTVERQSVAWALDRLLTPMRLTCRIVDEKTLQVTSPQREADRVELEFYPVADLVSEQHDGGRLIELVQTRLGQSAFGSSRGGGVLRFDADSQCLLAAMPQPGQIALADLLDQRRANKQRVGPESQ